MESQKPKIKIIKPVTRLLICFVFLAMLYSPAYAQYTKLHDFDGTNGRYPVGSLISDGTFLYGLTPFGGINSHGTIFKLKPDGTGYVKLLDFDNTNGGLPHGSLYADGTFLYGMTPGNLNDHGTIFKIKPDGTGYEKILDFDSSKGSRPFGTLISDGTFLYGTTNRGGVADNTYGTIFKIKPDGTGYVKLFEFDSTNGIHPLGTLFSDGDFLYGMTETAHNRSGNRTIFKIKPDGSGYVKLKDFDSSKNGSWLYEGAFISDGIFLYGTTRNGGTNDTGTIFKIKPDGSGYIKIFDFDGTNGALPLGSLISDGTFLYGTTSSGGAYDWGTLFKLKPDGTGFEKLLDFDFITSGAIPIGTLISDGVFLYGTTYYGGTNYLGTIFKYCLRPTASTDTISACGSYSWHGSTYYISGTYTHIIPNAEGCDSIMTLNLTITSPSNDSLFITSCKGYTSPSGKYTYNSTGFYFDTIPNSLGCDSVLSIHYIRTTINNTVFIKSCDTLISPSGKYIYRTTGIYSDTLVSHQNCDSIITTELTIKPLELILSKSNNITCDTPYATLSATGGDFYYWEPEDGLSDVNTANPIATPNFSRTYYVTATNSLGCSKRDSVIVFVEKKVIAGLMPNVFTPNNDEYNDCFNVSALTQFKTLELTVFNRWGQIVYHTTDPKACWNGTSSSGQALPSGVYFYNLNGTGQCDDKIINQGTITLLR